MDIAAIYIGVDPNLLLAGLLDIQREFGKDTYLKPKDKLDSKQKKFPKNGQKVKEEKKTLTVQKVNTDPKVINKETKIKGKKRAPNMKHKIGNSGLDQTIEGNLDEKDVVYTKGIKVIEMVEEIKVTKFDEGIADTVHSKDGKYINMKKERNTVLKSRPLTVLTTPNLIPSRRKPI